MKSDFALGCGFIIVIIAFIICALFHFGWGSFWLILLIEIGIAVIIAVCLRALNHKWEQQEDEERRVLCQKQEEERKKYEEKRKKIEDEIREKYGNSGLDIKKPSVGMVDRYYIRVFFKSKIILLDGIEFNFSDIVSCNIVEKIGTKMDMQSVQTPTTNNAGIAGRAVIGGLLAGPAGAIIGGLTAKNKVKTEVQFVSTPVSNYCVNVFTKKEKQHCVNIEVYDNWSIANEIKSAIDGVISYNA